MKTTEKIFKELIAIVILFLALAVFVHSLVRYMEEYSKQISDEDKCQMQEMIDYHRAEGRKIQVY